MTIRRDGESVFTVNGFPAEVDVCVMLVLSADTRFLTMGVDKGRTTLCMNLANGSAEYVARLNSDRDVWECTKLSESIQ